MILYEKDLSLTREFFYNLALVAPSKASAKHSISQGKIFLDSHPLPDERKSKVVGYATDDYLSIRQEIVFPELFRITEPGVITSEQAKEVANLPAELPEGHYLHVKPEYDYDFWYEFVAPSIVGNSKDIEVELARLAVSPDRLRKFSLLQPRGTYPLDFKFVRSTISRTPFIRWRLGPNITGTLAPLNRTILGDIGEEGVLW